MRIDPDRNLALSVSKLSLGDAAPQSEVPELEGGVEARASRNLLSSCPTLRS